MNASRKTQAQLVAELETLRAQLRELQCARVVHERAEQSLRELHQYPGR